MSGLATKSDERGASPYVLGLRVRLGTGGGTFSVVSSCCDILRSYACIRAATLLVDDEPDDEPRTGSDFDGRSGAVAETKLAIDSSRVIAAGEKTTSDALLPSIRDWLLAMTESGRSKSEGCRRSGLTSRESIDELFPLVCELIVLFCTICIVCAMRSSVSESAVRDVCREDIDRACCVDG